MGVIGMCGYVFFSLPSVVRLQKQLNNVELKKKKYLEFQMDTERNLKDFKWEVVQYFCQGPIRRHQ